MSGYYRHAAEHPLDKILLKLAATDRTGSIRLLLSAKVSAREELVKVLLEDEGEEIKDKVLLRAKVDINAKDEDENSALIIASRHGYESLVKLLIKHRADIGAEGEFIGTALHVASANGQKNVVQLLLKNGGDVHKDSFVGYPLGEASAGGHTAVVELLLEKGAKVNAASQHTVNALWKAARQGHKDTGALALNVTPELRVM